MSPNIVQWKLQALVNQLDTTPDPSLNHADVQLEVHTSALEVF